jgi:hypothetical protein
MAFEPEIPPKGISEANPQKRAHEIIPILPKQLPLKVASIGQK